MLAALLLLSYAGVDARVEQPGPPDAVFLDLVIDRSGSMQSLGSEPSTQTAKFIRDQIEKARETGTPTFLSLTTFDTSVETVIDNANLLRYKSPQDSDVKQWLSPRGATRLVDTALERLTAQNENVMNYLDSLPQTTRPNGKNATIARQFVLLTDGQDNASVHSATDLNIALSESRDKHGTLAVFLASNQDAIVTGQRFGFERERSATMSGDQAKLKNAYKTVSRMQMSHFGAGGTVAGCVDCDIEAEERAEL